MGFSLRDTARFPAALASASHTCPTNKHAYDSKAEAMAALKGINRSERDAMRAFRCGYCDKFHLGHRRGR